MERLWQGIEGILEREPYGMPQEEKNRILGEVLRMLTDYHRKHCPEYRRILDLLEGRESSHMLPEGQGSQIVPTGQEALAAMGIESCPMLPVTLFKQYELKSVPKEDVFKALHSSGTTGQKTSTILLDERTAALQQRVLAKIMGDFIGAKRMPMLVMDAPGVLKNREMFTARGAGVLGFSIFASEMFFALKEDYSLDVEGIREFLGRHQGRQALVFGFTHMVWQYLCQGLEAAGVTLDLSDGFLVHGGGWKKLQEQAVSERQFRKTLARLCGLTRVSNYYGMAEQTGTVYMECEHGHLHASSYSEIVIRSPWDFSPCKVGEEGLVQVLSPIALSYPGHSLLTEDKGVLLGIDNCPCGRKGKYFKLTGRLPKAEIRGCSNV